MRWTRERERETYSRRVRLGVQRGSPEGEDGGGGRGRRTGEEDVGSF